MILSHAGDVAVRAVAREQVPAMCTVAVWLANHHGRWMSFLYAYRVLHAPTAFLSIASSCRVHRVMLEQTPYGIIVCYGYSYIFWQYIVNVEKGASPTVYVVK